MIVIHYCLNCLDYLDNLIEGFDSFLDDTDHNPSLTGFYLMRICKRSLRRANTLLRRQASKKKVKKFKLKTVWDRLNVDHPFGAFNDYIQRDEEGEDKFDSKKCSIFKLIKSRILEET